MEETLTPHAAAQEMRRLAGFEDALRHRVEGLTWMLLGLVIASTFLAYALAVSARAPTGLLVVLWAPWLAMGLAVSWGIRRSLSLASHGSEVWLFAVAGAGLLAGVGALFLGAERAAPTIALTMVSALAAVPALARGLGYTHVGRRTGLALAAFGILSAAVVVLLEGSQVAATVAACIVAAAWVAGGVYEVLQG